MVQQTSSEPGLWILYGLQHSIEEGIWYQRHADQFLFFRLGHALALIFAQGELLSFRDITQLVPSQFVQKTHMIRIFDPVSGHARTPATTRIFLGGRERHATVRIHE